MYKTLNAPLSVHLEVNTSCNQRCRYCYNFWRSSSPKLSKVISKDLCVEIVEQLSSAGVFHVIINGGEPLIEQERVVFLMRLLSKNDISFSLNSNLTLLTSEIAKELFSSGLRSILVSLLSFNPSVHDLLVSKNGSFGKVVNGIKIAVKEGIKVSVNMVVNKKNLGDIEGTGLLSRDLGVSGFSATRVIPPRLHKELDVDEMILSREDVESIISSLIKLKNTGLYLDSLIPYPMCFFGSNEEYSLLGNRTCSGGKTSMAIGADGKVRACPHHEKMYGSVLSDSILGAWGNMREWRDLSLLPTTCHSCRYLARCGGGCRIVSSLGSLCKEDPIIKSEKKEKLLLQKDRKVLCISHDTVIKIKRECKFREDSGIGIINTGGIKNTFVTPGTLKVIKLISAKKQSFSPDSLKVDYGINMSDEKLFNFLSGLVYGGVAQIVKK